jgi:cephalosporin-C deacetylase-like acetyl esterase
VHSAAWTCAALAILAIAACRAPAAEPPAAKPDGLAVLAAPAGDALRTYLLDECGKHFAARAKEVEALDTPEKIQARIAHLKEAWMAAVGPFPEKTPLNARTVATVDAPGCRIEKVIYESRPGHHVTANLYVPKEGTPPFPGVLVPCGHSNNGKASEAYQMVSLLLARHGFVVLCYDPIGQGERIQTITADGKTPVQGTTEHTLVDIGARLVGLSAAHYRIWDGVRSIDYLASRPEVDPARLGCTGNSGGGTMTSYLMVTDDRILAAAPSCYITSLERLFATIGPQDGEQNIPGQVARGIDHADYLLMRAPRPTLALTATKDFFDIDGSWASFREAKRLYGILGFGERVSLFEFPDGHGFSTPRRTAALRWMRRWLQGKDDAAEEPPDLAILKDAELQVTQSGQVVRDLKGVTTWDLNQERARALAPGREAFWRDHPPAECLAEVRRLAAVRTMSEPPKVECVGTLEREGTRIERLRIDRPGEPPLVALLFLPQPRDGRMPAVLYASDAGKAADAAPGGPIDALVKAGKAVLAVDVRGCGETAPEKPKRYWHNEYPLAYLALHLDRPLLGQRTEDVLAALDVLARREEIDAARIAAVGIGACGPVVLHAAALDARLGEVTLRRSIASWMEVVETPLAKEQLSQVVPAALTRYDLPDLVKSIAPRPVRVEDAVDPTGKPKAAADAPALQK